MLRSPGAEGGFLLSLVDSKPALCAGSEKGATAVYEDLPLEVSTDLCLRAVNYSIRTASTVLIANASREAGYENDPYVRLRRPGSILCVPLKRGGTANGVLYLENKTFDGAFTAKHAAAVKFLPSFFLLFYPFL